jgi:NADPH-dependent glutamate synthase beta subunit-like oxidoreductase
MVPLAVAIVGSGPSAFFTADALLRSDAPVQIDLIERLAEPFGLIRFGVAPDHAATRKVIETFRDIMAAPQVALFCGIEVGRTIAVMELLEHYHAVVLATGAPADATLNLSGSTVAEIYGAGQFVGWYNGHPDQQHLAPALNGHAVAIVGMGNVALDIARLLARTPEELAKTDMSAAAVAAIGRADIRDIYICGRRGPLQARFGNPELREIGSMPNVHPVVDSNDLIQGAADATSQNRLAMRNLPVFQGFSERIPTSARLVRIHFKFHVTPQEIQETGQVPALCLLRMSPDGRSEPVTIRCGTVISAIGFRAREIPGVPFDSKNAVQKNQDGRVMPGLYVVGWAKRGPSGVIGTSKPDGVAAAQQILADTRPSAKGGRTWLRMRLQQLKANVPASQVIDFRPFKNSGTSPEPSNMLGAPR